MILNWGVLGLGKIAHHFVKDLQLVQGAQLCAVASRSMEKAADFAAQYGAASFYGDYLQMLDDPMVDIVYIATPHHLHYTYAMEAIRRGKHVLCEKPLTLNVIQTTALHEAAAVAGVFLMEALWSRFNPTLQEVFDKVQRGDIGQVKYLHSTFSFFKAFDEESRLFSPALAGGSILDVGIYPLFLSYMILGQPREVRSSAILHENGVDLQMSATLEYEGSTAHVMSGLMVDCTMVSEIYGTHGHISIGKRWHEATEHTVTIDGGVERFYHPKLGRGYAYEISECHDCIAKGRLQSAKWSHQDSKNLMRMMDAIRLQVGVSYPSER